MKSIWPPQDQVFWYLQRNGVTPCRQDMEVDVAVIGGGMAGLSAAQAFAQRGKKVAVFEQYYCGSGASGKSSGFISPDAELSLTDFADRHGLPIAHEIWRLFTGGVEIIRNNIEIHKLACDYQLQNTLVLASSKSDVKSLQKDHANFQKVGYKTHLYSKKELLQHIGSAGYFGGIEYEDTFGINAYLYCQEMKKVLQDQKVRIFEETPVTQVHKHTITTLHATIKADYIIICTDRFIPDLGFLTKEIYHAQTFLLISQELTKEQIRTIFPHKNLMAWDTDLIYNYFRIVGNNRLMLGGASLLLTYASNESHNNLYIQKKLTRYFQKKFPRLTIQFEHIWPGLIGLSKDIAPIAGRDKDISYHYYIGAVAGLPIAAALGNYCAQNILEGRTDLDPYFSPYRSFTIGKGLQTVLGTKASFAISNLVSKL